MQCLWHKVMNHYFDYKAFVEGWFSSQTDPNAMTDKNICGALSQAGYLTDPVLCTKYWTELSSELNML
jgi:hypothetical protein